MDNPVAAYGRWLAETPDDWPDSARGTARLQFLDTIAVSVPGALEPATRAAFETVRHWGAGPAVAFGTGTRLAAPWAALVNGTAAHALDFDDNFDPAKAHASAVLVPAILALGEQEGVSGRAAIDAYIAGLQILGRVGQGVNPVHRNRGWHATATLGAIGAAAAAARLLGLDADKAANALSLATSMAAGSMAQFGTMAKPLHAGLAAKAGILAVGLAGRGLTAGRDTFDGPAGINRLMVGPDYEALRDGLAHIEHGQDLRFETAAIGEPLLILSSGLKVKRFPNCASAHRAMDGLLSLMKDHGFTAAEVESIDVRAPATHLANLMYEAPSTPLEAKFSLEHALATVLLTNDCQLGDFDRTAIRRPELLALYSRINRHPVDKAEGEFPTEIVVSLVDGRRLETSVRMPRGSVAAPLDAAELHAKFEGCVAGLLAENDRAALATILENLPNLDDIGKVTAPLLAPVGQG